MATALKLPRSSKPSGYARSLCLLVSVHPQSHHRQGPGDELIFTWAKTTTDCATCGSIQLFTETSRLFSWTILQFRRLPISLSV